MELVLLVNCYVKYLSAVESVTSLKFSNLQSVFSLFSWVLLQFQFIKSIRVYSKGVNMIEMDHDSRSIETTGPYS